MNNIKQKYISSAFLLLVSSVLVKAISAVYKIPLTAYIGATGRGYFTAAYNLYMPLHAVIMGAFPVAVSHLVSKYNENNNSAKIHSLKKASNRLFFIVGAVGMAVMLLLAKPYAQLVASSNKSILTICILAPTVLFSSIAASRRSLAEGYMNMVPTSVSQIIEAVFKVVFGLLFARLSMGYLYNMYMDSSSVLGIVCNSEAEALSVIYPLTSAAAMGGVTVGSFFSMIYVCAFVGVKYNSHKIGCEYKASSSMMEIVSFSMPIIASTLIQSLSAFLDNSSVQYFLSMCDIDELKTAYFQCVKISKVRDEDLLTYIYGLFSAAQDFKNLIPGFTMALGVASVPAISAAFEAKNVERLSSLSNSIFKYTSVIAFGGGLYLTAASEYILNILYGSSNSDIVYGCKSLIEYFGLTIIFYSLSGTVVYAVQAIGCAKKSIPSFVLSAIIRVAVNYLLVTNAKYNIYGAVLSGTIGYAVILVSNLYIFKRNSGVDYKLGTMLVKPCICSLCALFLSKIIFASFFVTGNKLIDFIVISSIYFLMFTVLLILSGTIRFTELKLLFNYKNLA